MRNIITIQHTQSEQHINKMIGSLADWNLTELGIKQAHSIGKKLADEYKNQKLLIYSSDLPRAEQTPKKDRMCIFTARKRMIPLPTYILSILTAYADFCIGYTPPRD